MLYTFITMISESDASIFVLVSIFCSREASAWLVKDWQVWAGFWNATVSMKLGILYGESTEALGL